MVSDPLDTPVVLLVYNRPELTQRLVAALAEVRPRTLLIVADGPRSREDEVRCGEVRALLEVVPWDCHVHRNYADRNLGVRDRPSSGIDWAFTIVDEAIILEDDCLPAPSFFPFCAELLSHYRDDERVMQIGGSNFQRGLSRSSYGYYFSIYFHLWGWATWRRAWRHYDVNMTRWPELKRQGLLESLPISGAARRHWSRILDRTSTGQVRTWDFQWQFAMWSQYGLAAVADTNLISNIGFGAGATHTTDLTWHSEMPTGHYELRGHPSVITADRAADDVEFAGRHLHQTPLSQRLISRWRRRFGTGPV